MRVTRPTIVSFILLAVAATPVAAAPPSQAAAQRAEHERIVRYWTPARMAAAKPRDFVRDGSGFKPAAKPPGTPGGGGGGGGGGDGDSTVVTGASWTKGGDISEAVGKVFFSMGNSDYTCSGTAATDSRNDASLVLTAAHCAYDESGGAFATNWIFIPAWDEDPTSYKRGCSSHYDTTAHGCWSAMALVVHEGYATAGGFNTEATVHDFAFAVVGPGGKSGESRQLDATVPTFGLDVNAVVNGSQVYAFGYPAAQKYKGNDLTYCAGKVFPDSWNSDLTWGLECNMTGGSSGGPWMANFDASSGNSGKLGSLNSYGYSGVKNMYGPDFNSDTTDVYDAANGASSNTVAP